MLLIDLTGQRFGYWTVVELAERGQRTKWKCVCICGTERSMRRDALLNGRSKSCGCKKEEFRSQSMRATNADPNPGHRLSQYHWDYEAYRKALEFIAYYGLESDDPVAFKMREVARKTLEKHRYESQ